MDNNDLIGRVALRYLRNSLAERDSDGSTSRYLLDNLSADQTAAVAQAILNDELLSDIIDIKLPRKYVENIELPEFVLTDERATYYRNAVCLKDALLVASIGDDEQQSLRELSPIGTTQLLGFPDLWVEEANCLLSLPLDRIMKNWWRQALRGLLQVRSVSLNVFSGYVMQTVHIIESEGEPLLEALGLSLPYLRIPSDKVLFLVLNNKTAGHVAKWRALFAKALNRRACYMLKYNPTHSLLSEDQLSDAFDKTRDVIPENCHSTVEEFIKATSGWNVEAEALCNCEWDDISSLFNGLRKEKLNLGLMTREHYEERESSLLSDKEREYLVLLAKRKLRTPEEEDELFYDDHRLELKEAPNLKAKWDKFVFGAPLETGDLLSGLMLAIEAFFTQVKEGAEVELCIRSDKRTKQDLRTINYHAGSYFATKYKGLVGAFPRSVKWDTGELFNFNDLLVKWRKDKKKLNRSHAKAALRIRLFLELKILHHDGREETATKQIVWFFAPNAVSAHFASDLRRLVEKPFIDAGASREVAGAGRNGDSIDLRNTQTLHPSFAQDRGSLVPVYKVSNDLRKRWILKLDEACDIKTVTAEAAASIQEKWIAFSSAYEEALNEALAHGVYGPKFRDQATLYGELIDEICLLAPGDRARHLLLRPILGIGCATISGGSIATIITPWHPLRMLAISSKTYQLTQYIKELLLPQETPLSDARLFFRETAEALSNTYYPEITVGWEGNQPTLLCKTDQYLDYSLHESPVSDYDGFDETNENPNQTSNLIVGLLKRYLKLFPHERANLSAVLYNCDSARLPQSVVSKVTELHDQEDDMRCNIVLRHRDKQRLAELYEMIVDSSDQDAEVYATSETTTDFMARLRIGIMADQAPPPKPQEGRPKDIVFLQDVIARLAQLEWYSEKQSLETAETLCPTQWTRRRPSAADDMKSVTYLTNPIQTLQGWLYLRAISSFFKSGWNDSPIKCFVPVRLLDFANNVTKEIFTEIHNLGNWVVNYDELLDRRQLFNQGVRVIRYKQTTSQGRNVLISSTAPIGLLRSMVKRRLIMLNLEIPDEDIEGLAEQFIEDANRLSGDLALRAAKRGNNASELMGVVLSQFMTQQELGKGKDCAWFFLDDYAEWLGQKEEQIADILALCPETTAEGQQLLGIIVTEAKYIEFGNLRAKQRESQKQVRDTVKRIRSALFSSPPCLDRTLWISRFSNMITSGLHLPRGKQFDLTEWQEAFRKGDCNVYVRGYSHVFVHLPTDSQECSDASPIVEVDDCFQEIYSRRKLRELVKAYANQTDATFLREIKDVEYSLPDTSYQSISLDNVSNDESVFELQKEQPYVKPIEDDTIVMSLPEGDMKHLQKGQDYIGKVFLKPSDKANSIQFNTEQKKWLEEVALKCRMALQQFQLRAKLLEKKLSPNCAILKFEGSANLTIDQVMRKQVEFLTTYGLNVTDIRPESGRICIYIEREHRQIIRLQDTWSRWDIENAAVNNELLIGVREDNDELLCLSPRKNAPHTLIAGSTGSGKSVLMQNIILNIAFTSSPTDARIILIDPKRVSFSKFRKIPHLDGEIIKQSERSAEILNSLVDEMHLRYRLFEKYEVEDIYELNALRVVDKLPCMWVIHDEFALWMIDKEYASTVTSIVNSLAVAARAAGIFLIFAAQRPDKNVLPMQLRSNLGNRLVLKVDGAGTSEIALGEKGLGAEKLLGNGHMIASLEGITQPVYVQVPFIPKEDLLTLVDTIIDKWK